MFELKANVELKMFNASQWVSDLSAYLEAVRSAVDVIDKQIKEGNLLEIKTAARFLKDSSYEVGAEQMAKLYENLERSSSSMDEASVTDLLAAAERIRAELPKVEKQIQIVIDWNQDA